MPSSARAGYAAAFTSGCRLLPTPYNTDTHLTAADLLMFDTDKIIGHLEKTLGRLLPRKKPVQKKTSRVN